MRMGSSVAIPVSAGNSNTARQYDQGDRYTAREPSRATRRRLIRVERISQGTLDTILVHPREVFKRAIMVNASAVVLTHNHPSGDPTPSPDDVKLTNRMREAGRLIGIELLDHVIIGNARGLRCVLRAYVEYYLRTRTHLSLGKDAPVSRPVALRTNGAIVAIPHLSGLHHRYEHRAA